MSLSPYQPTCLVDTATQVSLTGSTALTTLYTFVMKANTMGPNDMLRIVYLISCNNSVNTKTPSITIAGNTVFSVADGTTIISHARIVYFLNRNSTSSQITPITSTASTYGAVASSTFAVDTTIDVTILFRGQLANAADNMALEKAYIELWRNLP